MYWYHVYYMYMYMYSIHVHMYILQSTRSVNCCIKLHVVLQHVCTCTCTLVLISHYLPIFFLYLLIKESYDVQIRFSPSLSANVTEG